MDQLPPPCKGGCGRPVRPRGTTRADYPITRTWYMKARGMCETCYQNTDGKERHPRPDNCTGCERPLRGSKQTAKDFPGTVRHWGKGICDSCKDGAKSQKKKSPEACAVCAHPLRPRKTTLEDYPGTKQHDCNGLCTGCRGAVRRGTIQMPEPGAAPTVPAQAEPEDIPNVTDPGLLRMRQEREERRRRQERAHRIRVEQEAVQRRFIANRRKQAA